MATGQSVGLQGGNSYLVIVLASLHDHEDRDAGQEVQEEDTGEIFTNTVHNTTIHYNKYYLWRLRN